MAPRKITAADIRRFIPARRLQSRKGQNGTVLVLGGSYIYHGAPILASMAALRSGADLVYTAVPKINVQSTRSASPNLIVIPLADQKLTRGAAKKLLGVIPKGLDSATLGMGLAVADRGALVTLAKSLVDMDVRLSLDASALVPDILPSVSGTNSVVTPHAGEFARLFGQAPPDNIAGRAKMAARCAADHGITVLLKGPTDIITDGKTTLLNPTKTPAMTVGGTGDVLSGIVASVLAQNRNPLQAAAAAAFVNGRAGMMAQKRLGLHMVAGDLIEHIPAAMKPFDRIR